MDDRYDHRNMYAFSNFVFSMPIQVHFVLCVNIIESDRGERVEWGCIVAAKHHLRNSTSVCSLTSFTICLYSIIHFISGDRCLSQILYCHS